MKRYHIEELNQLACELDKQLELYKTLFKLQRNAELVIDKKIKRYHRWDVNIAFPDSWKAYLLDIETNLYEKHAFTVESPLFSDRPATVDLMRLFPRCLVEETNRSLYISTSNVSEVIEIISFFEEWVFEKEINSKQKSFFFL